MSPLAHSSSVESSYSARGSCKCLPLYEGEIRQHGKIKRIKMRGCIGHAETTDQAALLPFQKNKTKTRGPLVPVNTLKGEPMKTVGNWLLELQTHCSAISWPRRRNLPCLSNLLDCYCDGQKGRWRGGKKASASERGGGRTGEAMCERASCDDSEMWRPGSSHGHWHFWTFQLAALLKSCKLFKKMATKRVCPLLFIPESHFLSRYVWHSKLDVREGKWKFCTGYMHTSV